MAKRDVRRRSALQTLAVSLLALGIVAICVGLYSLIQAFDVFDIPIAFKVWFSRALVALVIGVIALRFGGRCVEAL
ncbi:hypothetical protein [Paraburkholderia sp. EG304]|uniref:hypothetical protein n=1 Tax=Paraburkholderia sp. EG304 TaxID=3237015 RepID=UPI0039783318